MYQRRPAARSGAGSSRITPPQRKVVNCIADDTALVAGIKSTTRNGIRQWVARGHMRLFVPLHAIQQLQRQKTIGPHSRDADDTLTWLDDAITRYPWAVALQGGDDHYESWADVERYAVPRPLLSETDANGSGPRVSTSLPSPPTSPVQQPAASPPRTTTPVSLRPLFNYIIWRVHQEANLVAALDSFIFLCNDEHKVKVAKGFDVKCKRLEELREAINREEREHGVGDTVQPEQVTADESDNDEDDDDENDEEIILFKPRNCQNALMDPNDFDRTTRSPAVNPRGDVRHATSRRGARPITPRGNARPVTPRGGCRGGGRGDFHKSPRGRGTGGRGGNRGGGFDFRRNRIVTNNGRVANAGQVDPDSFSRPKGGATAGKLWEPT
ncbi:hypothetical protein K470DRAFT_257003 [Piedraia hortae CBS 480.64]|uniref:PIN domain-containing protein n=1 Tax=Piedraia hortae CBS 480.64 TaxID=1314780 RepID=A0A6A7C176_9PEZI|nr:hypothetical protein K470DRAFT_257003 [Piedraia hortae CBS 480.64]